LAAERAWAAEERDALRRQLLQAEEDERRRLSRELHDEVGQHLTALGLGLQALSDVTAPGSEADRRAAQLRELVSTMGRELHALAVRLRPKALDDFGLEAALTAYAEEWSRQSGIAVAIHAEGEAERLPDAIESAVYRVVQEALTNIAKHSGATHASVVVERRDGHVQAIVEDDGRGIDAAADTAAYPPAASGAGGRTGLGLLGIRERVALLGGTVDVESVTSDGRGTTLFVRIPIESPIREPHAARTTAARRQLGG
jgi:signal transduction histidine kinase